MAVYLAELKANAVKDLLEDDEILLTADTIVLQNDTIFGKPKDRQDAVNILKKLSGSMHEVITGVCLLSKTKTSTFLSFQRSFSKP